MPMHYIITIIVALTKAQSSYESKVEAPKAGESALFKLAWAVREVEELIQQGRKLIVDMQVLIERLSDEGCNAVVENIARSLTSLKSQLTSFVKALSKHQRESASHIFVMMISSESRNRKPYALPLQCLPIRGLKDKQVREFADAIIKEMSKRNMKVAGKHLYLQCIIIIHACMCLVNMT